jgi:hypothetical protein
VGPAQFNYSIQPDGSWRIDQNDFVSSPPAARAIELLDTDLEASSRGSTAAGRLTAKSLRPLDTIVIDPGTPLVNCAQKLVRVDSDDTIYGRNDELNSCDDLNEIAQVQLDVETTKRMQCFCRNEGGDLVYQPRFYVHQGTQSWVLRIHQPR